MAQAIRALVSTTCLGGERLTERLGLRERYLVECEGAALDDGSLEESSRPVRDEVGEHGQAAGRLARDGHVVGVAAELRDVALNPAQRSLLVHKAVVPSRPARPRGQSGMREEAERTKPVVDRDDNEAVRRELRAVVVAGAILRETAAVDPHEYRPSCVAVQR